MGKTGLKVVSEMEGILLSSPLADYVVAAAGPARLNRLCRSPHVRADTVESTPSRVRNPILPEARSSPTDRGTATWVSPRAPRGPCEP